MSRIGNPEWSEQSPYDNDYPSEDDVLSPYDDDNVKEEYEYSSD